MSTDATELFDAEFQRRLAVLRRVVAQALAGRAPGGGGGAAAGRLPVADRGGRVEFAGHRAYVAGDDLRDVDWSAYARLETLVVKEFEAPRDAHLLLVLDRSASMDAFGKDAAAVRLAAALGWMGLAAGARVACCARGGASRWLAAPERFPELLDALRRTPAGGAADLPAAVARAPAAGTGRRTVVVLSDLYEAAPYARALEALARRRASAAITCHVVAPEELRPPGGEDALLLDDAETGERLAVTVTPELAARFRSEAERFLAERAHLAAKHGARHVRIGPADDLVAGVERVLLGGAA